LKRFEENPKRNFFKSFSLAAGGAFNVFKGKLLKKFSLKNPFKIFQASADGKASLFPSARIMRKGIGKGLSEESYL